MTDFVTTIEIPDFVIDLEINFESEDVIDVVMFLDQQTYDELEFNEQPNKLADLIVQEILEHDEAVEYWINHRNSNIELVTKFLSDKKYDHNNWGDETRHDPDRRMIVLTYYV